MMSATQAIDVHAHYGTFDRGPDKLLQKQCSSASADTVIARATAADTRITIVSPLQALMPRGHADPVGGNTDARAIVATRAALRQWVVIDPRVPETYEQAADMLADERCVGIKVHPEEHQYPICEHGDAIFEFAAAKRAVVLTHSGEGFSMPEAFIPFADRYPEMSLILAHIGCNCDGDLGHQVRAVRASRHGNVYTDSSSAQSILPGLIEWAVRELGADRVLYGSDSPLYMASMQRVRIDSAQLSEGDKRKILATNAEKLLGLGPTNQAIG